MNPAYQYPPGTYFESGEKGTISFSSVDESKLRFTKENKFRPFFETVNYWGIQRKRVKMQCRGCGFLVGYIYDDGPPLMSGKGQIGFGPSQVIPRAPRFRFKIKALRVGD